jgi:uncharacterized protein YndB with AHSA1/START domain
MKNTAKAAMRVSASVEQVWRALTDRHAMPKYMRGDKVETTWKVGGPITWKGEDEGKPYTEVGKVLEVVPNERLAFTRPGKGDATHTITYTLAHAGECTLVTVTEDDLATAAETDRVQKSWETMLGTFRNLVEEEGLIA